MNCPQRTIQRWGALALPAALLALFACNTYQIDNLSGTVAATSDPFTQVAASKVDILWVVDNSGSMRDEQENLKNNFGSFIEFLVGQKGVDYQMGVITTDVDPNNSEGAFAGRLMHSPAMVKGYSTGWETNLPWLAACPDDLPPFICSDSSQPHYTQGGCYVSPEDDELINIFGCLATTGMCASCGFEKGLEAVRLALSPPLILNENAGFLRPDAALAIIIVSDENDCSDNGVVPADNGNNCEWNRDSLVPVADYVNFLFGLKADPSMVAFAAIVGSDDPWDRNSDFQSLAGDLADVADVAHQKRLRYNRPYSTDPNYTCYEGPDLNDQSIFDVCVDNVRPSCMSALGQAFAGYRYIEAVGAFGPTGITTSICVADFSEALKNIGAIVAKLLSTYCLAKEPTLLSCVTAGDKVDWCPDGLACDGLHCMDDGYYIDLNKQAMGEPADFPPSIHPTNLVVHFTDKDGIPYTNENLPGDLRRCLEPDVNGNVTTIVPELGKHRCLSADSQGCPETGDVYRGHGWRYMAAPDECAYGKLVFVGDCVPNPGLSVDIEYNIGVL